jgi:hypothetical protein
MNHQVDFVCIRPDHQTTVPAEALTIHEETWAYCPSARPDAHEWRSCRESGLHAHVILRHREEPEWTLSQSVHVLAVQHAIVHASGVQHVARHAGSAARLERRRRSRRADDVLIDRRRSSASDRGEERAAG